MYQLTDKGLGRRDYREEQQVRQGRRPELEQRNKGGELQMIDDFISRIAENLVGRVSGPMKFRLILQPMMAAIFAVRAGLKDAKEGRPAYFWAIFTEPAHRSELIKEGWKAVGKIFIIAIIIDVVYQYIVFRWFYPGEAIIVAVILALVPYLLIRGPVNRIARR